MSSASAPRSAPAARTPAHTPRPAGAESWRRPHRPHKPIAHSRLHAHPKSKKHAKTKNRSTPSTSSCAGARAARPSPFMMGPPLRPACPTMAICWPARSRCGREERRREWRAEHAQRERERERKKKTARRACGRGAAGPRHPPPPSLRSPCPPPPPPFPPPGHRHPVRRLHRPRRPPPLRLGLPRPARRVRGGQAAGRQIER